MTSTPIRAALYRAWGGRLPAVRGHEAAGVVEMVGDDVFEIGVGDHVVMTLIKSCGSCHNCQSGASVACTDELITGTYPIDEINETIASVKNGHAVRNVILFDQSDTTGAG